METLVFVRKTEGSNEIGRGSLVKVNVGKGFSGKDRIVRGKLMMDYEEKGDGIPWLLQPALVLAKEYTEKEIIERKMYEEAPILADGEEVEICMVDYNTNTMVEKKYRLQVLGDYMDCGIFREIQ